MELMLADTQSSHYLTDFKVTVTHCTFLLLPTMLLLDLNLLHPVDNLLWKAFAHITDLFLQLKQLLVCHLIGIDVVLVLGMKSHRKQELVKILSLSLVYVFDMFTSLLVLLLEGLQFLCHLFNCLLDSCSLWLYFLLLLKQLTFLCSHCCHFLFNKQINTLLTSSSR